MNLGNTIIVLAGTSLVAAMFSLVSACGESGGSSETSIDANTTQAADARTGPDATPNTVMSFFVTSSGNGAQGGNLGGLSGADAKCQNLGTNAGAGGRTWRAYLSTDNPVVNARDRIGSGPWSNQQGVTIASNLADLHGGIAGTLILTELGEVVPNQPLDHDILTGSDSSGNLMTGKTCADWTDSSENSGGQVGHADIAEADLGGESWNSAHDPQCSEKALKSTAGTGRIYCFAID